MPRLETDAFFIKLAELVAGQATCPRRSVGCVLINARKHIIATGYNGVASGMLHCTEVQCPGAELASGTGLEACEAIHAEANALLQCKDVYEIDTAYVTASPCIHCTKMLLNTSCRRIVYSEEYPHSASRDLWLRAERLWEIYPPRVYTGFENDDDIPF